MKSPLPRIQLHFCLERNPMACEEIVDEFNDLRSDIVLLFDLKNALNSAEYELQTSLHRLKSENGPISSTQPLSASSNSSNDTPRTVNIRFYF
jgi:DNA methyltransferase 1-associated protein 1